MPNAETTAALILVGADVLFNKGRLTKKLFSCFNDILKKHYDETHVTYVISQKDLVDAGFGC